MELLSAHRPLRPSMKETLGVRIGGTLRRKTHYFGSAVFLSESSLIPQAVFSQPVGRRRSCVIFARLHCARKLKSRAHNTRFLRLIESTVPRLAALHDRCPPKANVKLVYAGTRQKRDVNSETWRICADRFTTRKSPCDVASQVMERLTPKSRHRGESGYRK